MKIPSATYRIQFSADFGFKDLEENLDYLEALGISTIYASPFFQASKGSTHGYDIVDPLTINKEIGTLEEFKRLREKLKKKNMDWLQDIVPNHMAFNSENVWLRDIFEKGPDSKFYHFFDIDWDYKNWKKLMAPFLGDSLENIIKKGEIQVKFGKESFSINYFENSYPASARSYSTIFRFAEIPNWQEKFENISHDDNQKKAFLDDFLKDVKLREKLDFGLKDLNNSPENLREVLELQHFLPVHWQTTEEEINYRRFFTINGLICLKMEDEKVFKTYHSFIKQLFKEGLINSLRIDHVDGLFDPKKYLEDLRKELGNDFYLIVEKILEAEEVLPADWPVQGTTGYDFLANVNQLFIDSKSEFVFSEKYEKIAAQFSDYKELVFRKKLFILKERMGGELKNLLKLLQPIVSKNGNFEENSWKGVLTTFLASFPVYRIYPSEFPLKPEEKIIIQTAFEAAYQHLSTEKEKLELLRDIFLGNADADKKKQLYFLKRCQQFTGPLAAKGVEDTGYYIYNRLISQNEVGDSPENFGMGIGSFHEKMQLQKRDFPHSLNATATHDTKRGEDARMRLNVLSELPQQWFEKVAEWQKSNAEIKKDPDVPDANEEYFIYQALIGAWAFEKAENENLFSRTKDYMQKVLREAKIHSNWSEPNEVYEQKIFDFISDILKNKYFRESFDAFQKKVAYYGSIKSLGQLVLKCTAPGIPDIYQGSELWDLSYVDPDNRRPVDYQVRKKFITEIQELKRDHLKFNLKSYSSGKVKIFILQTLLNFRKNNLLLFQKGEYLPLFFPGEFAEKLLGFFRIYEEKWVLIVVPVLVTDFFESEKYSVKKDIFEKSEILLPEAAPKSWRNEFTDQKFDFKGKISLKELFKEFPIAVFSGESKKK